MKKNLGLVWCQVDINCGWRQYNAKHKDGIPVPSSVIRILCSVVLAQQLKRKHTDTYMLTSLNKNVHYCSIMLSWVRVCVCLCGMEKRTVPSLYLCDGWVCC